MRRLRLSLALAAAFAAGIVLRGAFVMDPAMRLHLSGDGRDAVAAAFFPGSSAGHAETPEVADVQVILLRRWQNLEGLPALARLCGRPCAARPAAGRLDRPSLNGLTRVVILDLSAFGLGAALDEGRLPEAPTLYCVVNHIAREARALPRPAGKCLEGPTAVALRPRLWSPRARPGP